MQRVIFEPARRAGSTCAGNATASGQELALLRDARSMARSWRGLDARGYWRSLCCCVDACAALERGWRRATPEDAARSFPDGLAFDGERFGTALMCLASARGRQNKAGAVRWRRQGVPRVVTRSSSGGFCSRVEWNVPLPMSHNSHRWRCRPAVGFSSRQPSLCFSRGPVQFSRYRVDVSEATKRHGACRVRSQGRRRRRHTRRAAGRPRSVRSDRRPGPWSRRECDYTHGNIAVSVPGQQSPVASSGKPSGRRG